jgi:hypothetical protein
VQYNVRYVGFCAAPFYVLVARGIISLPAAPRVMLASLLVIYSVGSGLRASYYVPWKENFRDTVAYVARERQPGDCGFFVPPGPVPRQWALYDGDQTGFRLTSLESLADGTAECSRVWMIDWTMSGNLAAAKRVQTTREQLETTYSEVAVQQFFWVNARLYRKK